jgi:hypothetical protein
VGREEEETLGDGDPSGVEGAKLGGGNIDGAGVVGGVEVDTVGSEDVASPADLLSEVTGIAFQANW